MSLCLFVCLFVGLSVQSTGLSRIPEDGAPVGPNSGRRSGALTPGKLQQHNETYASRHGSGGSSSSRVASGTGTGAGGGRGIGGSSASRGGIGGYRSARDNYSESGATAASNKSGEI